MGLWCLFCVQMLYQHGQHPSLLHREQHESDLGFFCLVFSCLKLVDCVDILSSDSFSSDGQEFGPPLSRGATTLNFWGVETALMLYVENHTIQIVLLGLAVPSILVRVFYSWTCSCCCRNVYLWDLYVEASCMYASIHKCSEPV
jgi:hypothetical protein